MELSELIDKAVIGSGRGRKPAQLELSYVRDLNESDLDVIQNPPALGVKTQSLTRIRESHHRLAKLLADGVPAVEASQITGYSSSRISILKQDPAFRELLSYYDLQKKELYFDYHQRLASLGIASVEELQQRLEETPEDFSNRELISLAETMLDRSITPQAKTGMMGKGGTGVNINVSFVAPAQEAPLINCEILENEK